MFSGLWCFFGRFLALSWKIFCLFNGTHVGLVSWFDVIDHSCHILDREWFAGTTWSSFMVNEINKLVFFFNHVKLSPFQSMVSRTWLDHHSSQATHLPTVAWWRSESFVGCTELCEGKPPVIFFVSKCSGTNMMLKYVELCLSHYKVDSRTILSLDFHSIARDSSSSD